MKLYSPWNLMFVLACAGAFVVGYFSGKQDPGEPAASPDAVADAKVALDTLVKTRRQGSSVALREAIELVDRISRGGQELLEPLGEAIRTVPHHPYNLPVSTDLRAGVPAAYANKKIALLEAVTRIGGDRAIRILEEVVEDRTERDWGTRVAAFGFLARHAEKPAVRDFYTRFVGTLLAQRRNDFVMTKLLTIAHGRLNADLFTQMSMTYRTGWATPNVADAMSVALHAMEAEMAAAWFMSTLVDESMAATARQAAVRALARIPDQRPAAAQYLLKKRDPDLLPMFLTALLHSRLEYTDLYKEAVLSDDIAVFRKFCDDQTADLESVESLVREMETTLGPEVANKAGVPNTLKGLRRAMEGIRKLRETRDE